MEALKHVYWPRVRRACRRITDHALFNTVIMCLILASTVALCLGMMAAGLGAQAASHLIRLGLGRGAEFAADRFAAELHGPDAIVSALRKILPRRRQARQARRARQRLCGQRRVDGWG